MESLALTHSFVAYESPEPELKLKSLDELGLKIPNAAWVGVVGMAVALSVVSIPGEAQAGGCYRGCGGGHHHHYAKVVTNCSRLNIRQCPGRCSRIIGKLHKGDHVALSGRYRRGWAQLADGGWVSKKWIY
ncbi:MAG TPA: peptide-binding protein [Microcoleaceae bacterium UBA10368]|jgi:SH3 domain protein|nr:peptide-binding protein [Microcoleaceae cyanobacterium UBA11344]HBK99923.1 peptide-binding protein [Microcoleaceae cyanobacterium UBA10368]